MRWLQQCFCKWRQKKQWQEKVGGCKGEGEGAGLVVQQLTTMAWEHLSPVCLWNFVQASSSR